MNSFSAWGNIIKKKHIYSIDLCRYCFAVLVVALHCELFTDINLLLGLVTTQALARTAVPFFLCVSGYFYFKKLASGEKAFWTYFKRLLLTYAIWSIPYYLISFFSWGQENIRSFLGYIVVSFLLTGSSYHFWFFPAILFSVAVGTVFFKMNHPRWLVACSIVIYVLGVLCCAYTEIAKTIPFLTNLCNLSWFNQLRHILFTGFPYFVSGYVVYLLNTKSEYFRKNNMSVLLIAVIVWTCEFAIITSIKIYNTTAITFGMYPLIICTMNCLLMHPMEAARTKAAQFRILANFTYYAHVLLMDLILWAAPQLFGLAEVRPTSLFFITVLFAFFIGLGIWKSKNRVLMSGQIKGKPRRL